MEKRCFLAGRKDSLFRQLVASLLVDSSDNLMLYESKSLEFGGLMEEILEIEPQVILLEESSPFSEDSMLMRLLLGRPGLPVIVIGEDSNLMHIVRLESRVLSSSRDLIRAIDLI